MKNVGVEKIVIVGAPTEWAETTSVKVGSVQAQFEFHPAEPGKAAWALVKKPAVAIGEDWKIEF